MSGSGSQAVAVSDLTLPVEGGVRTAVFCILGLTCSYAPLAILFYLCHRQHPAIRYRNPVEMAIMAFATFLHALARCMCSLYVERMSCRFRFLSFGVPLQIGLVMYVLAVLKIVLTFELTEMMVAHVSRMQLSHTKYRWLLYFRDQHTCFSLPRFCFNVVCNTPLVVILYKTDYSMFDGVHCPSHVVHELSQLFGIQFLVAIVASLGLSTKLSRVVDNFGLRDSFQQCGRVLLVLFGIYFPVLLFALDTPFNATYRIDLYLDLVICHTLLWYHIVLPLRTAWRDRHDDDDDDDNTNRHVLTGTAAILDAYLHTVKGFDAFSLFARAEFKYACVIAWKVLVEYRVHALGHLSATAIYAQHLAPTAPLPLDDVVSARILKRYAVAFESNSKYGVHPDADEREDGFFDVLLDAITQKLLTDVLPRFQRHPLGASFIAFAIKDTMQLALDHLLEDTDDDDDNRPKEAKPISLYKARRPNGSTRQLRSIHSSKVLEETDPSKAESDTSDVT
ncbi:Aste57867_23554 [Aphanomyces stellatus]|uniref:Aste57867_23554 protein n=1 Tax=Aphanomyces stellatus TaxID=120398 RepID=A0A485LP23_9STRA|nr:hypothetical protein As57867_023483 [Aphanomyces stellatus]VFU00199.1 Aste57867_23554 [Aphanomyces stellatus]